MKTGRKHDSHSQVQDYFMFEPYFNHLIDFQILIFIYVLFRFITL